MANILGKITAPPATTAPPGKDEPPTRPDNTLPDPTRTAKRVLGIMMLLALLVAWIWNTFGSVHAPFMPAEDETANFAFFAGFYVAAQVIERVLELVSPTLPWWRIPVPNTSELAGPAEPVQLATAKAAQVKADRAVTVLGIAAVLGVAVSCAFGLFFLKAIGFQDVSNTIDTFATGIVISAGTKPLHDFISGLQNKNTPSTGTAAS